MSEIKARLEDPLNPKGRAGNDTRDAYARLAQGHLLGKIVLLP